MAVKRCKAEVGEEMSAIFQSRSESGTGPLILFPSETTHFHHQRKKIEGGMVIKNLCLLCCPGLTGYKIRRAAGNRACRRYCLWERGLQILWSTEAWQINDRLWSSSSDRNINTLDFKTTNLDDFHYKIESGFQNPNPNSIKFIRVWMKRFLYFRV